MWKLQKTPETNLSAVVDFPVPAAVKDRAPSVPALVGNPMIALKVKIHQQLLSRINLSLLDKLPREQIAEEVSDIVSEILVVEGVVLNRNERTALCNDVLDELLGLGPLEPLLKDETINDILVNGHNAVFVERYGLLEKTATHFQDERHLLRIIQKIVSAVGRRVDESSPFVDARLADGSRVNAIIWPLAIDGSLLSIRKFSKKPISMERMIQFGSITEDMATILKGIVAAGLNVIISGGTGSGKRQCLTRCLPISMKASGSSPSKIR